jgi:small redox-active disulfide protein 2
MKIQILGMGCPKCKSLEANAVAAVEEMGIDATVIKIADMQDIMSMGVLMTPALAIDDEVKSAGKILTKEEIIGVVKRAM